LAHAAEESWQLDDQNIEPVHLLLGLLRETGSVAAELLRRHGVEIAAVRGEAEDLTPNLGDEDLESEAFSAAVAALPADRRDAAWRILEALGRAQVTVQVTSAEDSFTVSFDTIAPAQ
jgi:ATP-dependent Clp protease ATP-binding subunit ClpA